MVSNCSLYITETVDTLHAVNLRIINAELILCNIIIYCNIKRGLSSYLQNLGRKMTANDFVENLADLNDGENFAKEVLRHLYFSLKAEPLECEMYVL